MLCPVCNVDLVMADRQGIEIDYCPKCRGLWLDRGELDKLIERNTQRETYNAASRRDSDYDSDDLHYPGREAYDRDPAYQPKKKKKSFLSDIFDVFD
jgi:uncharacterized protein